MKIFRLFGLCIVFLLVLSMGVFGFWTDGLSNRWTLNNTAVDNVGGVTGALVGAIHYNDTSSWINESVSGSANGGSYFSAGKVLLNASTDYTVSLFVNPADINFGTVDGHILNQYLGGDDGRFTVSVPATKLVLQVKGSNFLTGIDDVVDNEWLMITIQYYEGNDSYLMWINDSFQGSAVNSDAVRVQDTYICGNGVAAFGWSGACDELVYANRVWTRQEISDRWNKVQPLEVTLASPSDNGMVGSNFNFSFNVNTDWDNCSLYTNFTNSWVVNQTKFNVLQADNPSIFNVSNVADDSYIWNVECEDVGVALSDVANFTVTVDTVEPNITLNPSNSWTGFNSSGVVQYFDFFPVNITFDDDNSLFGYELNISRFGIPLFNVSNESLSGSSATYVDSINSSGWGVGVVDILVRASDSHTKKRIKDYGITKYDSVLEFSTSEDNYISIVSDDSSVTDAFKKKDRYEFEFSFNDGKVKDRVFNVYSDKPIVYKPDSGFKAHFIVWNGESGNWVDFEGVPGVPTVTKVNSYHYKVKFKNLKGKVRFKSIGGLNVNTKLYNWYKGEFNESRDSVSIVNNNNEFFINVSYNNSFITNITGRFFFNGSEKTVSVDNNSEYYILNSSFITPSVTGLSQELPYYWNINVSQADGSFYDFNVSDNQTVQDFVLAKCNASITVPGLNYSLRYESNNSLVNGSLSLDIDYWIGDKSNSKNLLYFGSNLNHFDFCISPGGQTFGSDYTALFSTPDSTQRTRIDEDIVVSNVTTGVNLFVVQTSEGIFARFKTVDQFENVITRVQSISRAFVGGDSVIVEESVTDDSGVVTFFVNPDTVYNFTFIKTGFPRTSFTLRPTSTDLFTVVMGEGVARENQSIFTGIISSFSPSVLVLNNNTVYDFDFNLSSSFWNISSCELLLYDQDNNLLSTTPGVFTDETCDVSNNISTGSFTGILAVGRFIESGLNTVRIRQLFSVESVYVGSGSLRNFLDDLKNLGAAGFNSFTRNFLAVIFIFVLLLFANQETVVTTKEANVLLIWILVLFFSYIEWFTFENNVLPEGFGLEKWMIFYVITLFTLGFFIKRKVI